MKKLEYVSDEEMLNGKLELVSEAIVYESPIGGIVTNSLKIMKRNYDEVILLKKRPAQILCTCFKKSCGTKITILHLKTCELKLQQKVEQH